MRILFLQKHAGSGGSKASLATTLEICRSAPEVQVELLVGEEGPLTARARELEVPLHFGHIPEWRKPAQRFFMRRHLGAILRSLRGRKFDWVVSNEMWWAPQAAWIARGLGARSAAILRDGIATARKAASYRLGALDRLLCVSASLAEPLRDAPGISAGLRVVHNAVRPPAPDEGASRRVAEALASSPHIHAWIAVIGTVGDRKNQIAAIETLAALNERSGTPWGMLLVGRLEQGYGAQLEAATERLGMQGAVRVLGELPTVRPVLEVAACALLTSRREGMPRSVIEALRLGKPAFSTRVEGVDEIFGDERPRFVAAPGAPSELAQLMLSTLEAIASDGRFFAELRRRTDERFSDEAHLAALRAALE